MSPIFSSKKFTTFLFKVSDWNEQCVFIITEEFNKTDSILILLSGLQSECETIEKELKVKLWKKLGQDKFEIRIVPEINLLYISENLNIKKYDGEQN